MRQERERQNMLPLSLNFKLIFTQVLANNLKISESDHIERKTPIYK